MEFMRKAYMMPVARFSPYLVGILTGYFMHKTSKRRLRMQWVGPNVISEETVLQFPICSIWILTIAIALTAILGLHGYFNGHNFSKFESVS